MEIVLATYRLIYIRWDSWVIEWSFTEIILCHGKQHHDIILFTLRFSYFNIFLTKRPIITLNHMKLKLRECIETIMTCPFYVHQTSLIVSDGKMDSVYVTVYSKLSPWNRWNSVNYIKDIRETKIIVMLCDHLVGLAVRCSPGMGETRVLFPIEAQKICGSLVVTNSTQCYIYLVER